MEETRALVLVGEVISLRKDRPEAVTWLRDVAAELDEACGAARMAPFGLTQDDELQGLLAPDADPLAAVLQAALHAGARRVRWACVLGSVDPGEGPATQRRGQAFAAARQAIVEARTGHERLVIRTGDEEADALLGDMAPALVDLLDGLTDRQRAVAHLALLDGLPQYQVADRLKVRRATTSVAFRRAKVLPIGRLAAGIRRVYARAAGSGEPEPGPAAG
jgi:hypothetical protein